MANSPRPGIDADMIVALLAAGATAHRHPSGSLVILTLPSGPPSMVVQCRLMEQLEDEGRVVLGPDGVYRSRSER